jgi:hypothetical protein
MQNLGSTAWVAGSTLQKVSSYPMKMSSCRFFEIYTLNNGILSGIYYERSLNYAEKIKTFPP